MAAEKPADDSSLPPELARLPPGRHGLPRDFVAVNHRDRLIAACVQVVGEKGYVEMTVADVIKEAAVSRRTFYEFFDDKEACFLAAYDTVFGHFAQRALDAYSAQEAWPDRVRAGLRAMLQFLAAEPLLARLMMVEPLAAGPPLSDHHREGIGRFASLLDAGREEGAESPAEGTADFVLAGAAFLIIQRIIAGEAEQLEELLPAILESVLAPYLGPAAAERIARE
ncbi:MAG TPA: TetR/AcrR family transcriptional regulator [Solirubrobacterales bacterium]|nr:TetR/AcrR family transcriptional regulator [Solirubrobacterales bacterium]